MKVSFLGAAGEVTGSSIFIESKEANFWLILECFKD